MARVLFVATPLYGHVAPLLPIAADQVGRGHDVTFITGPAFEDGVLTTGARFVPFHGKADVRLEDLAAERDLVTPGPPQINFDLQRIFIDPIPVQHELVQRELAAAGEPVVLIADTLFLGGWPVALGAPGIAPAGTIAIGVTVYPALSVDAPPPGLGMPLDTSPAGRAAIAEANAGYRAVVSSSQAHLEDIVRSVGATRAVPFIFDGLAAMPDRLLQLSPAGLEYPRSDAPPGYRFVGPIPPAAPASEFELPSWWDDVQRAERVVVVSQGTVDNTDTTALFEPAMRSLSDIDALVVLTLGREDTILQGVPANVRVAGFVPHELLLPHTDVFVTNGGFGGILKALSHGVPLVVAGDNGDKPEVAAHVAWSGAGIDLNTGHPSDEALCEAVRTVLRDPAFRKAAHELQAEIRGHRPLDEITSEIDELLTVAQTAQR
jgi:UDP:flavonoid glycosyltransferase YjiC (YdhE family)